MQGWILDVYPVAEGMCVWLIDGNGRAHSYLDRWAPSFYLKARPEHHHRVRTILERFCTPFSIETVEKKEFFSNETLVVLKVTLKNPLLYQPVVKKLLTLLPSPGTLQEPLVQLFSADLDVGKYYFYETGLFPLAFCSFDSGKRVLQDSPWTLDYDLPPLRYAYLGFEFAQGGNPNHRGRGIYTLTLGREWGKGVSYVMDSSESELLHSLNRHIQEWDPDILLTDWGDSFIMPRLDLYSKRCGIPLRLSRDPNKYMASQRGGTFFSYGQTIYKATSRTLFGRLHIDTKNSFTVRHTGLDGLFEIVRASKIPIQQAARSTIGSTLSSMQHEWAIRNNYLVPMDKGQTEDFRPADELVVSDRGGLVYEPDIGWHEDLVELDFISMYPEIMIRHNITPEAVNCACCSHNKVPEINHHLCQNRTGLVPAVLGPIVKKRLIYKQRIQSGHKNKEVYKARSDAFKWALVTCFGYLGFRNARFGKIEAHECVNTYGREALLRAKEIAEERGFSFVHAIVDSLWLKKPDGATEETIEALRKEIEEAVDLPLGYEGEYRWIRFCPSRMNARVGVPNRYFGAFKTGEIKVRGIELRRHDAPLFIKNLQTQLLNVMAEARNLAELATKRPEVTVLIDEVRERLLHGGYTPMDLAVTLRLSKLPEEYVHNTLSAIASKKLAASGVELNLGETIQYVVAEEHDKVHDWRVTPLTFIEDAFEYDQAFYNRLVDRAIDITPFYPVSSPHGKKKPKKGGRQLSLPGFDRLSLVGA